MADRVAVMYLGRIVEIAETEQTVLGAAPSLYARAHRCHSSAGSTSARAAAATQRRSCRVPRICLKDAVSAPVVRIGNRPLRSGRSRRFDRAGNTSDRLLECRARGSDMSKSDWRGRVGPTLSSRTRARRLSSGRRRTAQGSGGPDPLSHDAVAGKTAHRGRARARHGPVAGQGTLPSQTARSPSGSPCRMPRSSRTALSKNTTSAVGRMLSFGRLIAGRWRCVLPEAMSPRIPSGRFRPFWPPCLDVEPGEHPFPGLGAST